MSSVAEIFLLPDSNVFLQAKVLREIPWKPTIQHDVVYILIGATVQREVDRLKTGPRDRRGDRARKTNSFFREILDAEPEPLVLREKGPRVLVSFAEDLHPNRTTPATLDRNLGDDLLVEEALTLMSKPGTRVAILTHDIGVERKAKRHAVPVIRIPDSWLLEAEPDPRTRQIRELQDRLSALEKSSPAISMAACDNDGNELAQFNAEISCFPPLSKAELDECVNAVRAAHPIASAPHLPASKSREANSAQPAVSAVEKMAQLFGKHYSSYEGKYLKWLDAAEKEFERLHLINNAKTRYFAFSIQLENTGLMPADELLVELSVSDNLLLYMSDDADGPPKNIKRFRKFPETVLLDSPPSPRNLADLSSCLGDFDHAVAFRGLDFSNFATPRMARDRHTFYLREDSDKPASDLSLECQEFRHGVGRRYIDGWIFVPYDVVAQSATLTCRVSARNIPTPEIKSLPISIATQNRSTMVMARKWRLRTSADTAVDDEGEDDE